MTETEELMIKGLIQQITVDAMNDGILAAVEMIRVASVMKPDWSFEQLAVAIENTVTKDGNGPLRSVFS